MGCSICGRRKYEAPQQPAPSVQSSSSSSEAAVAVVGAQGGYNITPHVISPLVPITKDKKGE